MNVNVRRNHAIVSSIIVVMLTPIRRRRKPPASRDGGSRRGAEADRAIERVALPGLFVAHCGRGNLAPWRHDGYTEGAGLRG